MSWGFLELGGTARVEWDPVVSAGRIKKRIGCVARVEDKQEFREKPEGEMLPRQNRGHSSPARNMSL